MYVTNGDSFSSFDRKRREYFACKMCTTCVFIKFRVRSVVSRGGILDAIFRHAAAIVFVFSGDVSLSRFSAFSRGPADAEQRARTT